MSKEEVMGAKIQLEYLDADLILLTLEDQKNCNVDVQFNEKQWENVKKAINKFQYNKKGQRFFPKNSVDGKDTGIRMYIDQDGEDVILHFDGDYVSSLTNFTEAEWEKFKKQVNEFE